MDSEGFEPIACPNARILILGTLPGQESLRQRQYYAHPRNGFWPIMEAIFGIPADGPYDERVRQLAEAGVALWDVCGAGHRPGSLDSAIRRGSEVPNDFAKFLQAHPRIELICFNGTKAAELFRKHVQLDPPVRTCDLPSTSPANAATSLKDKIAAWSRAIAQQGRSR